MVEVFKTNVQNTRQADLLLMKLRERFTGWRVNFDLADHDRILRIESRIGLVPPGPVIALLKDYGFHAEVLPDTVPVLHQL